MGSLREVEARRLDAFHQSRLQPSEAFLAEARGAVSAICEFLKARSFRDPAWAAAWAGAPRVLKGGSLGKGTSMRNGSDADLVLFLNIFESYSDQEKYRRTIIEEFERQLTKCQEERNWEVIFEKSRWPNPRVSQFKLRSKESVDVIEFDVLPAYDALGQYKGGKPNAQIYVSLIGTGTQGQFSPCFTELQRDFILGRPTKLKNLIRLVKCWYKEIIQLEQQLPPPKYALELLTVYAWEEGSGNDKFDMAEGFRTVLWLIEKHKEIRIYWTKYYDFENEIIKRYLQDQLRKTRPVILDPADPTANVGEGKSWDRLAKTAAYYAGMKCCQYQDGSFVKPWNVPGVHRHSRCSRSPRLHQRKPELKVPGVQIFEIDT